MANWSFVADMASASPTTLLDLNTSPWFVGRDFRLDPPEFRKVRRENALMPGQQVAYSTPGNRTIILPLQMLPSATPHTNIENLGRQLAVDNILRVVLNSGGNPVFFRTFANPGYEATIRGLFKFATTINLEIEAEPYAYGVREEVTGSPFTIANDPALANGCFVDLPNIKGDAPTPLLILGTGTGTSGFVGRTAHFATRRRGTPSNYSNLIQAESCTQGVNTAVTVDATMSGGNRSDVTFANSNNDLRLSDTFPGNGTPTVEARGEYRVYARIVKTIFTDDIRLQLAYGTAAATSVRNDQVKTPMASGNNGPWWVDLGRMPVPAFADGVTMGYSGSKTKTLMPFVGLYAQRVSGTGNLRVDCLYFMPCDEPTTLITAFPAADTTYAIDGTTEPGGSVYALNTALDQQLETGTPPRVVGGGGFPAVIPGVSNRLHMLRNVDTAGTVDAIGNSTTVRVFYWPRWLEPIRT